MKRLTRRLALGLSFAALAAPALAETPSDITGQYRAEGMNANGSRYEGVVQVTQDQSTVSFSWTVGAQQYSGTGLREGRVVAVDWGDTHPVVYVVMPNGEMHGTWGGGTAIERLIPQ